MKTIHYKNLAWLIISAGIIFLDQWSKSLILHHLTYGQVVTVIPHCFNLVLIYNPGAAFSFLSTMPGWQRWFFSGIALIMTFILLKWLVSLPAKHAWLATAISLVIGGALGNCIDRLRLSYVIDFIQWYYQSFYWPAFNIADSAVVVGALMIAGYYLFQKTES